MEAMAVMRKPNLRTNPDDDSLGVFQLHFNRYLNYFREDLADDAEIVEVSVQFLRENQDGQLAEVTGWVRNEDFSNFTSGGPPLAG
ncbi:MAG TPA: hypothetical protein VFZ08_16355 [Terriglobia bacterium]|nr:hypothetical protein [Terriglobia bacterium]